MKASAVSAQAAVNAERDRAQGVAARSRRGRFMGRSVSRVPGNPGADSPRESRQASATARATGRPGGTGSGRAPAAREMDARLDTLIRNESRTGIRTFLERLVQIVREAEAEVEGMQRLLMKSRDGSLDADDWREFRSLALSCVFCAPLRQSMVLCVIEQLTQPGVFNRKDTEAVIGMLARLDDVDEYLTFHQADWLEAGTRSRVKATLPLQGGKQVEVERFVMPGRAIGAHFVRGYPSEASLREQGVARYSHAPGLSAVALTNAGGEVLYSGLRHDLFPAGELNDELFRRLTDEELSNVIGVLFLDSEPDCPQSWHEEVASEILTILRSAGAGAPVREAKSAALSKLQRSAHRLAAGDLASAAVLGSRAAVGAEVRGEAASIKLVSIALLKPADLELWRGQHHALSMLRSIGRINVKFERDECREIGRAGVRQFAFCVGKDPASQRMCRAVNRDAGVRLLGPLDSPEPGGDLKQQLDHQKATAGQYWRKHATAQSNYRQLVRAHGSTHWKSKSSYRQVCWLERAASRMERSVSALEKLGTQVKAMWTPEGGWPSEAVAQRQVAARLALIGYLMDETAVLSCAGGSNRVSRLESDINFLAAVTDSAQGVPPEIDMDRHLWRHVLAAFESPASPSGRGGGVATGPAEECDVTVRGLSVPVKLAGGRLVKSGFKVDLLQKSPAAERPSETDREPVRSRADGDRNPDVWLRQRPRDVSRVSGSDISGVQ